MHVEINFDPLPSPRHPPRVLHNYWHYVQLLPLASFCFKFFLVTASVFFASEPLTGGALPRSFPRREWRTVGVEGRLRRLSLEVS